MQRDRDIAYNLMKLLNGEKFNFKVSDYGVLICVLRFASERHYADIEMHLGLYFQENTIEIPFANFEDELVATAVMMLVNETY